MEFLYFHETLPILLVKIQIAKIYRATILLMKRHK
jgi:hypothetical protein